MRGQITIVLLIIIITALTIVSLFLNNTQKIQEYIEDVKKENYKILEKYKKVEISYERNNRYIFSNNRNYINI